MTLSRLADAVRAIAAMAPAETVEQLAVQIRDADWTDWEIVANRLCNTAPGPEMRQKLKVVLDSWHTESPEMSGPAIALALYAASATEEPHRDQHVDLVWTGPDSWVIPLRRTDQALLQLINSATRRILVVSFAVYKIETIREALLAAAQRQVAVSICLESPETSAGKIAYDTVGALGSDLRQQARVYVWPLDKRPLSPDGKHGSMHSKVAVADGQLMLISSANLTEYAMNLNMELGVLVQGSRLPGEVERHFEQLTSDGVLVQAS